MLVLKTSVDAGTEEAAEAVDGGPGISQAPGAFNNDEPTLVDRVPAGGNRVRRAEPAEKLV